MNRVTLAHKGAELDQAIGDWFATLTPVYTLPPQVKFSAVCNPTLPGVNLSWIWQDTEFASGIIIRRKKGEIPQTVGDGDLVCNIEGYEICTFTDTGFDSSDAESVGTYDTPVTWYYRAFPYNVNGNFQTNYQTSAEYGLKEVGVFYLAEGSTLSTLGLEDQFIFGAYDGTPLVWEIVHFIDENHVKVALHHEQIGGTAMWDEKEPNNADSGRVSYGCNRYAFSNVRQFLNADGAANEWFVAQTDTDVCTTLAKKNGFLYGFTEAEKNLIVARNLTSLVPEVDGGGTETLVDKVWLPGMAEVGFTDAQYLTEDSIWDKFAGENNTNAKRTENWSGLTQWTRTPVTGNSYQVRVVGGNGNASSHYASYAYSLRPGLILPLSSFLTWDEDQSMWKVFAA